MKYDNKHSLKYNHRLIADNVIQIMNFVRNILINHSKVFNTLSIKRKSFQEADIFHYILIINQH